MGSLKIISFQLNHLSLYQCFIGGLHEHRMNQLDSMFLGNRHLYTVFNPIRINYHLIKALKFIRSAGERKTKMIYIGISSHSAMQALFYWIGRRTSQFSYASHKWHAGLLSNWKYTLRRNRTFLDSYIKLLFSKNGDVRNLKSTQARHFSRCFRLLSGLLISHYKLRRLKEYLSFVFSLSFSKHSQTSAFNLGGWLLNRRESKIKKRNWKRKIFKKYKAPELVYLINTENNYYIVNEIYRTQLPLLGPIDSDDSYIGYYTYPLFGNSSNQDLIQLYTYLIAYSYLSGRYINRNVLWTRRNTYKFNFNPSINPHNYIRLRTHFKMNKIFRSYRNQKRYCRLLSKKFAKLSISCNKYNKYTSLKPIKQQKKPNLYLLLKFRKSYQYKYWLRFNPVMFKSWLRFKFDEYTEHRVKSTSNSKRKISNQTNKWKFNNRNTAINLITSTKQTPNYNQQKQNLISRNKYDRFQKRK